MRKIIVSRAVAGALDVLSRGSDSPAGSRRPVSGSLLAAAVVVVVVGLAGAAPAMANTAPSMITSGNDVSIAFEGANHSLLFFWAVNGTATWHKQTVAGTGTAFSAPSMIPAFPPACRISWSTGRRASPSEWRPTSRRTI
jgi:hypothetical protein